MCVRERVCVCVVVVVEGVVVGVSLSRVCVEYEWPRYVENDIDTDAYIRLTKKLNMIPAITLAIQVGW